MQKGSYFILKFALCTLQYFLIGEPAGIRTQDTRLKRAVLYQLSYRPVNRVDEEAYNSREELVRQQKIRLYRACFMMPDQDS